MRTSRVIFAAVLLLALAGLALISSSFIQENLVIPLALVLLFFWRIVQSIDQRFYWFVLVFLAPAFFYIRLLGRTRGPAPAAGSSPIVNATIERINYWRASIGLAGRAAGSDTLEQDLGWMLASLYAARQHGAVRFQVYDDLKQRKLELPDPIYALVFPAAPAQSRRSLKRLLAGILELPGKAVGRWTGREAAEYYQSLDRALRFMESLVENEYADGTSDDSHH